MSGGYETVKCSTEGCGRIFEAPVGSRAGGLTYDSLPSCPECRHKNRSFLEARMDSFMESPGIFDVFETEAFGEPAIEIFFPTGPRELCTQDDPAYRRWQSYKRQIEQR